MSRDDEQLRAKRAALYVRMSTEHQQYSTSNQRDVILAYANLRGLEIVKDYSDDGKSGLNIEGRDSLAQMIRDVEEGKADYSTILVYDVSRWGRFQDADESAHYEFVCRRAGVSVHYCAEQFENDGTPVSTIIKGVKRMMAGEYSRELSTKVFQGACRLVTLGYRQGGTAGFGLRRVLIDGGGNRKGELKIQCHKMIVKAVKHGATVERIAASLNMPLNLVRGLLTLLDGINEEAAHLLRDKIISPKGIRLLKKVSSLRQIEMAEIMVNANNFGTGYVEALVLGTPKDQLVNPDETKVKSGLSTEDIARMEREMESLERSFKAVETNYTENMMNLTLARGYIKRLLGNPKIKKLLAATEPEFLAEFENLAAAESA